MAKSTPSMKDVAKAAGVSITTVSRVLSDNAIPTQETRQRVLAAVKQLGYQAPPRRRTPANRTTLPSTGAVEHAQAIAFLTSTDVEADVHGDFDQHEKLVSSLQQAFDAVGYRLYYAKWDPQREAMPAVLNDPQVVGAVIHSGVPQELGQRLGRRLPVVYLDKPRFELPGDLALCSITHAMQTPLRYLMELGHRRIVMFLAAHQSYYREVFLAESARLGLEVSGAVDELCQPRSICDDTYHEVLGAFATEMAAGSNERPTAVILWYRYALGLVEHFQSLGWSVPDDVSVLGIRDRLLNYMRPPITVYDWPMDELGRSAADLLISRIKEPDRPFRHLAVRGQIVERASCAPPSG